MGFKIKINDAKTSKRYKDKNGYLHIEANPIAKAGVFDYLKREVEKGSDSDEIVKVCRTFEDLNAHKDLFSKMPIVLGHKWVGDETDKVAGAIGEVVKGEEPYLKADLIIYSQELIKAIESGEIVELSPAYEADIVQQDGDYKGEPFQYEQKLKSVNHLAVVELGRSGHDLKIQDEKKQKKGVTMLQSLANFFNDSLKKLKDEGIEPTKAQDEDKRKLIEEMMAISAKSADEFKGGEEEKIKTIAELAEKIAYKPSESSKVDDNDEPKEGEGDKKTQDNDEGKGEESNKTQDAKQIADSIMKYIDAKFDQFSSQHQKVEDNKMSVYNEVSQVVGAFNALGMSENDMYKHGYNCLTGAKLADGIDAKSAFALESRKFQTPKVEDSKPVEKFSDEQKNILNSIL